MVCILPIPSLLFVFLSKIRLSIELEPKHKRFHRYEKGVLLIKTKTYTFLPIAKIQGTLQVHNTFTNEVSQEIFAFGSEKSQHEYEKLIELNTCGKYEYTLSNLRVFDALGLFSFRLKQTKHTFFYCLPVLKPCVVPLPKKELEQDFEYDPYKKGNERSEVIDVHEYQPGDSIHAIHWKLSAKMDTYMVRDFASSRPRLTSLCFDLYGSNAQTQEILGNVYGCSYYLILHEQAHEIIQYAQGQVILKRQIQTKEQLDACLCDVFNQCKMDRDASSMIKQSSLHSNMYVVKHDGIDAKKKEGEQNV